MATCPHCQTVGAYAMAPCPTGDGFFCLDEEIISANPGNDLLGRAVGGRFVVTGTLGAGSMAQVFQAHQMEVDRSVALKVFRVGDMAPGSDPVTAAAVLAESRDRFAQEARVLGKLAHPNCVTLFDFGSDESCGLLYIAMEHVGGVSLRRAMNRGLKLEAIIEIVEQVLFALREAHSLAIVHRDLKPENIILSFRQTSDEPVVKVVDFGIAKLLGHDRVTDKTRVGALFGTPAYMSPEQCRGEVDTVGPHSDIYALGCILFEMITGRLPFEAAAPTQMIRMHTDDPIPAVVPRPGVVVPDELVRLVQRCLQKRPEDRFADAEVMLRAIVGVRQGPVARPIGPAPRSTTKRVVVPRNQISGIDIEPPNTQELPVMKRPSASPKIETRPQVPGGPRVHDTNAGNTDLTGGIKMSRIPVAQRPESSGIAVLIALVFVVLACVALFYFMWRMVSAQ